MANISTKHIKVSAPGKIILHGEHAVVYQKTALALSLGLRTRLDLRETVDGTLSLSMDRFIDKVSWRPEDVRDIIAKTAVNMEEPETIVDEALCDSLRELVRAKNSDHQNGDGPAVDHSSTRETAIISFLYVVVKLCKLKNLDVTPSLSVTITSEIAISAGLGSSAAFAVCVVASLLSYFRILVCDPKICGDGKGRIKPQPDQLALINHWAYIIEKIVHGNASGIDNAVSTYGGVIKFADRELELIPNPLKLDVIVVDTLIQRDTKRMIEVVRRKKKLYPSVINPILDSIDGISKMAFAILQRGNDAPTPEEYEVLKELISMNQNLLCALGVSHPALDDVCTASAKWRQAAKLTGGGGGGCAIVILDPDLKDFPHIRQSLLAEFRKMEFRPIETDLGGPGVLFHPLT